MEVHVQTDAKQRLAKIAGQVNGIQRMVDEQRYCVDILTQVSALRAALDQLGVLLLTTHLEGCVYGSEGGADGDFKARTPAERMHEIKLSLNRFLK